MRWLLFIPWILLSVCPSATSAEVHKCIDATGIVTFTDMPCARGETMEPMDFEYHAVNVEEARAIAAERAGAIEERQEARRQAQPTDDDQPARDDRRMAAPKTNPDYNLLECLDARSLMDAMRSREPTTYRNDATYAEYERAAERYCEH